MSTIIISVISSSFLAAIISGLVSLYSKRIDYKNEYYKHIISKRVGAYEFIERQLAVLKFSLVDPLDKKTVHYIFTQGVDQFVELTKNIDYAIGQSLWISNRTQSIVGEFGTIFFLIQYELETMKTRDTNEFLIGKGKEHYKEIAALRVKLENSVKQDLLNLYKVKSFETETKNANFRNIKLPNNE